MASDLASAVSAPKITAAPSAVGDRSVAYPTDYQSIIARWFMFSDHGVVAQRHMVLAWLCVLACGLVDAIWLPSSKLTFVASNWSTLGQGVFYLALVGMFIIAAFNRLRTDDSRLANRLRTGLVVTELLCRTTLPIAALLTAGVTLSYIITAADLPLRDDVWARIDSSLGFDWLGFLAATNSRPFVATLLMQVYQTTGWVTELVILWLCVTRNGERLAEFLATLGLCTVGLCASMLLVPAAGGFAYHEPAPQLFDHYSAQGEMWGFGHTYNMLRDGSLSAIDLSALDGIVSFPSFHTVLGVIGIYAARDTRWLFGFVLLINATMIVSTMPVGGHHLADVLAGAGLTLGAIPLVRRRNGISLAA
jgi:membrane-associated phospholipid phosphatase